MNRRYLLTHSTVACSRSLCLEEAQSLGHTIKTQFIWHALIGKSGIYIFCFSWAIPVGCKLGLPCGKVSRRRRKMNESVGRMLRLAQYRYRRCDRLFYHEYSLFITNSAWAQQKKASSGTTLSDSLLIAGKLGSLRKII